MIERRNRWLHCEALRCSRCDSTILFQVLCLEKEATSDSTPSAVQVRKSSSAVPEPQPEPKAPAPSTSDVTHHPAQVSAQDLLNRRREADDALTSGDPGHSDGLVENGRSASNLAISSSQQHLAGNKEPTPSIASDISNPYAAQELQLRLQQLHK